MKSSHNRKPFQKVEFLVRDWQNFRTQDVEGCEIKMQQYLETILASPDGADELRDTRKQIHTCLEDISCFLMRHPGLAVTSWDYDGDTAAIDPLFKGLADRYCDKMCRNVVAKNINGRDLTASELGEHIAAYAKLFENQGNNYFPQPTTLLAAMVEANNINASRRAIYRYKELMDEHVHGLGV